MLTPVNLRISAPRLMLSAIRQSPSKKSLGAEKRLDVETPSTSNILNGTLQFMNSHRILRTILKQIVAMKFWFRLNSELWRLEGFCYKLTGTNLPAKSILVLFSWIVLALMMETWKAAFTNDHLFEKFLPVKVVPASHRHNSLLVDLQYFWHLCFRVIAAYADRTHNLNRL